MSLSRLKSVRDFVAQNIERGLEQEIKHPRSKTSPFSQELFDRRKNFPEIDELLAYQRSSYTHGVGNDPRTTDADRPDFFLSRLKMVLQTCPKEELIRMQEPILGSPRTYCYDGITHSIAFIVNVDTYYHLRLALKLYLPSQRPLKVLEIGAGYGGLAYMMGADLPNLGNYTICDLPQNLFLSSFYLCVNFPDKSVRFLGPDAVHLPTELQFSLPSGLDYYNEKPDLVINTFSMQEMDLDTVVDYIHWVKRNLSSEGIFYSVNSHGKAGVQKPSDYLFQNFEMLSMRVFRKAPSSFFGTIPYEVVIRQANEETRLVDARILDALGNLMQLGLDSNLVAYCEKFIVHGLNDSEQKFLLLTAKFFETKGAKSKAALFSEMAPLADVLGQEAQSIHWFLNGVFAFVMGEKLSAQQNFFQAVRWGVADFAKCRLLVCQTLMNGGVFSEDDQELNALAPGLMKEILTFNQSGHAYHDQRRDLAIRLKIDAFKLPISIRLRKKLNVTLNRLLNAS